MDYERKGVIITGGNQGIGKALCRGYLSQGATVCMIDLNEKLDPDLEDDKLHFFCGDIARKRVLEVFSEFCIEKLDSIDILVNNACISKKGILSGCSYEDFDYVLSVGVKAPYYLSSLLMDGLIQSKGNIINIASSRSFQSQPDTEAYTSTKGGIYALTHGLSMSLKGKVRVNAIAPGWIDTTNGANITVEDVEAIPVNRVGNCQDIVNMAMFLSSEKASFITGETMVVDGGMSRQMVYHDDHNWTYCIHDKKK